MNKSIVFFIVVILFSQIAVSQNCTIFGVVKDSVSGTGVAYVHIAILDEFGNGNNVGGVTDEEGNYKIDKLPYGNHSIKVSCLGYKTKIFNDIILTSEQKKIKIDILIDIDIKTLHETVVVANRPSIELKPDKKVVHIDIAETAGGESVADFLKTLPEIKVVEDVVTLKTYTPTILVNGKPAGPAMINLTQVPASLISSVEVITNPSVRYNPEGLGGIINLKTRKMPDGTNGMIQGNTSSNNKYSGAGTLNFKTKKWNTFANIYNRYSGTKATENLNKQFDSGDFFDQQRSEIYKVNRVATRLGTDFEPDSMNLFTLYWEYSKRSGVVKNNSICTETELLSTNIYEIEQKTELDSRDHQICFNYIHTFKNAGELDVNISQFFGYEPTNNNLLYKDTGTSTIYTEDLYDGKASDIEINYSSTIFKTWNLTTGTSLNWERTEVSTSLSGAFTEEYHHLFGMDRLKNAYYLSLGKRIGKFAFTTGLRGEYINQKLHSDIHKSNENKFNFFPNIGLNYKINKEISLNLGYGRRIRRPHIMALTPYATIDRNVPSQRYIGNPNLQPSYTNSIDFGANFNRSKFSVNASISYMNTENDIAFVYYLQDSLTYTTRKNIATSQKDFFNLSFDYHARLFNMYRPLLTVRFGQEFYDSPDSVGNNIHKSFFNYHVNLYNIVYLPKDFRITVDITYYPPTYKYASTTEDVIDISFGVRKTFKNNFMLQVAVYNILGSKQKEKIDGDGFTSKSVLNGYTRAVNFGIMYKFGKPIKTRAKVNLNLDRIETD